MEASPLPSVELDPAPEAAEQAYADLHAALCEAAQVHRRLCAPRLVRYGDFEIASEVFAVRFLPGDFFTLEPTEHGVLLALGDVCGKGPAAGMWIPCLVALVGAHAAATPELGAVVAGVNRVLNRMSSLAPTASLFLARLDPLTGMLDYCSAGHPPAVLLRADGRREAISAGGPLLGVVDDVCFTSGRVELRGGDVLLAYSDGVIESRDGADEEFGLERLEAQLQRARDGAASADATLFSVLGAVQDFAAPRPLIDDTTLVVVRRRASSLHALPSPRRELSTWPWP